VWNVNIGVGDGRGGRGARAPPQKNGKKIFFGQLLCKILAFFKQNGVKFRNFVIFFGQMS